MASFEEIEKEQIELAKKVVKQDSFSKLELIGGIDVGFDKDKIFCVIVVCNYKDMRVLEQQNAEKECKIRYLPGFRAQNELGIMVEAFNKLKQKPDVLLINASGTLHPRKCGLASHLGVTLNQPVIGVTKKLLCGKNKDGYIILDNDVVGRAVVIKEKTKPLFVSVGHEVSLDKGIEIVKSCMRPGHKLPEPIVIAQMLIKKKIRDLNLNS
jgi:deoxyribonuclease V